MLSFSNIVKRLWSGDASVISAKPLAYLMSFQFPDLGGHEEQDAHEALTALLSFLHDELKVCWKAISNFFACSNTIFLIFSLR